MVDTPKNGPFGLVSHRLGALPILLDRIGLDAALERWLPEPDRRFKLAPATAIRLLLVNLLVGRAPLYGLGEWAAPYAPHLLGLPGGDTAWLNDDRVGRALVSLFDADRASLLTDLIVGVVAEFGVDTSEMHNDSTSVSVHGDYRARLEAQLDRLDDTERPSAVMVWTPEQTGEFLDGIQDDRLYPLFHLIAYRGTRRGETCGARWVDLNKAASSLKISEQLVQLGWKVEAGKPKSDAGDRTIGLDDLTNATLEAWRKQQIAEQLACGPFWIRSGRIFTRPDGGELHPADVTKHFNQLVVALGLPPIRLHDLRHGAATLALEGGVDIKVVQELLGHSSSVLTRDTYTSVSPRLAKEAAKRTAAMVPRRNTKAG